MSKTGKPMIVVIFTNGYHDITLDPSYTNKLIKNKDIGKYVSSNKGVVQIKLSSAYKTSSLNDIAIRINAAIKLVQVEMDTEIPDFESLDLDTFYWDFCRLNDSTEAIISHDLALEDITHNLGYNILYHPIQLKTSIHRNPHPVKTLNDHEYDSYCLLEEIGVTKQWAPCKIVAKKGDDYIVELKNRVGFHIRKKRNYILLSKSKMHEHQPELFR
jgi:hypothetical protein